MGSDCPKCGCSVSCYYDEAWESGEQNAYIKIGEFVPYYGGEFSGYNWIVECKCPKCGHEWFFTDSNM